MGSVIVALVGLIVVATVLSVQGQGQWEAWCHDVGGHVVSDTDTQTVTTFANGKPGIGVTSSTDYFCLSEDGRVLGVR